jgi:hypothetical protein
MNRWDKSNHDAGRYMDKEYYDRLDESLQIIQQAHREQDTNKIYEELLNIVGLIPPQLTMSKEGKEFIQPQLTHANSLMNQKKHNEALTKLYLIRRDIMGVLYEHRILFNAWERRKKETIYS